MNEQNTFRPFVKIFATVSSETFEHFRSKCKKDGKTLAQGFTSLIDEAVRDTDHVETKSKSNNAEYLKK